MPVTVTTPVQVPGPGGKTIHEHVGHVASGTAERRRFLMSSV